MDTGPVNVDFRGSHGVAPLCRKERWTGGIAQFAFSVAANDPVGDWTVRVKDIATGTQVEQKLTVRPTPPAGK